MTSTADSTSQHGGAAYTLQCPECQGEHAFAFVRVGAMVVCDGCGHPYRVEASHLTHQPRPRRQLEAGEADPLLPAGYAAPAEPTGDGSGGNSRGGDAERTSEEATGLTGLSGWMEREQQARADADDPMLTDGPGGSGLGRLTPAIPGISGARGGRRPRSPRRARRPRSARNAHRSAKLRNARAMQAMLLALAIALALTVALLGYLLYRTYTAPAEDGAARIQPRQVVAAAARVPYTSLRAPVEWPNASIRWRRVARSC